MIPPALGTFLAAAAAVSAVWGRALWYLDERSSAFRRCLFLVMGFTRRPSAQVRSLALTMAYCGLGLVAALAFGYGLGLRPSSLLHVAPGHAGLVILGAAGEISLAALLVDLGCRVGRLTGTERFREIQDIPWMKGLRELPYWIRPAAAALAAALEELFYRGVVVSGLTERLQVPALAATGIAGALFVVQQLVQVRTAFQALVIGCGCAAISLVGGLLVLLTGSAVPAMLCHASFVVFFMAQGAAASEGAGREPSGAPL